MNLDEMRSMARDVVAFLLTKDYDRQEIDFILRYAIEANEDDWVKEDEE